MASSYLDTFLRELQSLKVVLIQIFSDKKLTLNFIIGVAGFFTFPFIICCFVVSITPNAGFNAVLTGLLNICYVAGSFFVLTNSKTPIAIGYLLGVSSGMSLLNLSTAIYWGQLSKCTTFKQNFAQYTCLQPDAYTAICIFAVFLFLLQFIFTILAYLWRSILIDDLQTDTYEILQNPSLPNPIPGYTSYSRERGGGSGGGGESKITANTSNNKSSNTLLSNRYAPEPYGLQKFKPVSTSVEL